jgi:hypothetical protein
VGDGFLLWLTAGVIYVILNAFLTSLGGGHFAYCAAEPSDAQKQRTDFSTENSTPNTALSLDGRRQTGQSVGQHVCMG